MSIFSRIFKIGQATINQFIDNAEKPDVMLEQAIRDKEKQIKELRKSVAGCIASAKQTEAQYYQENSQKESWEQKAEAAIKAGREDLAIKALNRAKEHEQNASSLKENAERQQKDVEGLKIDLQKQQSLLSDYKRNKDFIVAQSKFADAKKDIQNARAKMSSGNSVDDLMARMKAKAERSRYEADAAEELAEPGNSLEKEFEAISANEADSDVASKLAEMKAKLGK